MSSDSHSDSRLKTSIVLAAALLASVSLFVVGGCNIFGPAFVLANPPMVNAEHKLEKDRITTVLIDDLNTVLPRRQYRVLIGQQIEETLLDKRAVTVDMVSSQAVLASISRERPGERRSIPQVGRDVSAEIVIWVTFDAFTLSPDGQSYQPTSVARVKVIDAVESSVLWPKDAAGHQIIVQMKPKSTSMPDSLSERAQVERKLAVYSAKAISELFYNVERNFSARAGN